MDINPSIFLVAKATAALAIFSWVCGTITTYVRGKTMESPNREDGRVMALFNKVFFVPNGVFKPLESNDERDQLVNRWNRIGVNNTSNIPIGMFIFFLAAIIETLSFQTMQILVWLFVASRVGHTLSYACSLQPYRTLFYSIGSLCMIIAAISIITF